MRWRTAIGATVLLSLFLLMIAAVNPAGNFPLNDDWNYARSVQVLLNEHRWLVTCWTLAAAFSHVVAGVLVCLPFGFSFESLRYETLAVSVIGLLLTYLLLRRIGAAAGVALLATACLLVNPLYFELSCTFMTDVPAAVLSVACVLLLSAAFERCRLATLLGAVLAAVSLVAARQVDCVVPLAALLTWLLLYKTDRSLP